MDELMSSPTKPLPKEWRTHQLTRMYEGLHQLEKAEVPSADDWRVVSDALNLVETLVLEMKVCEDANGLLPDAMQALSKAVERNKAGHSLRLDGQGIVAVRSVLQDYAELIEKLPARTMIRCHRLTEKRVQEILRGKRQPHDVKITKY
jgi:hypothetical protein